MNIGGFIKRLLPFVAAFAVGIFVASFFVDLSKPRFGGGPRWRAKRYHEMQQLRIENEELRNENLRLRNQIETLNMNFTPLRHPEIGELPMVHAEEMPPPPPAPKRIK